MAQDDSLALERIQLRLQRREPLVRLRVERVRQVRIPNALAAFAQAAGQPGLPVIRARSLEPVQDEERAAQSSLSSSSSSREYSGRFLMPCRVSHFDHASWSASISSRAKRGDMFTLETTTPGTSTSSTSCSTRANVSVNS